jgi:hypothetical protein
VRCNRVDPPTPDLTGRRKYGVVAALAYSYAHCSRFATSSRYGS